MLGHFQVYFPEEIAHAAGAIGAALLGRERIRKPAEHQHGFPIRLRTEARVDTFSTRSQ